MRNYFYLVSCLFFLAIQNFSFASHFRAADIYANYISGNTYEIVLITYTDLARVDAVSELDENEVTLYFGKNSDPKKSPQPVTVPRTEKTPLLSPDVYKNVYKYRYTAPGSNAFTVSWIGVNRNFQIINLAERPQNSGNYNIYLELVVQNDPALKNNTPILTIPPLDNAAINAVYTHNPGGYDQDGDFIVYELIEPKHIADINSSPLAPTTVPGYRDPDNPFFGAGSSFNIERTTGQITWDTPLTEGEYNIAFKIIEYRKFPSGDSLILSESVRDMQILVEDNDNKPPILILPKDTCILAGTGPGTGLTDIVKAYDPDAGHQIENIEAQGIFATLGVLGPKVPDGDTLTKTIGFYPTCGLIRDAEYQFSFMARDNQGIRSLSTTDYFKVKVVGEAPANLQATLNGSQVDLSWDSYNCSTSGAVMEIYRINCDTGNISRQFCQTGVPEDWGFVKIGETAISNSTYSDLTAKAGTQYCYLIAAKFPSPADGGSLASDLACVDFTSNLPLINKVDVVQTHPDSGSVTVSWSDYMLVDQTANPGPYIYQLFRSTDLTGMAFDPSPIFSYSSPTLLDSSFTDTLLDSQGSPYSYKLAFFSNGSLVGETSSNSTPRLNTQPQSQAIALNWDADVVWYFPDSLYQVVYIDSTNSGVFLPVDSVQGGIESIVIDSLVNGKEYCFYVETRGAFCADTITTTIVSRSNIICDVPDDKIPPCPPILSVNDANCENFNTTADNLYSNFLSWQYPNAPECEKDVVKYSIYYKPNINSAYQLIHEEPANPLTIIYNWEHDNLTSIAGCYIMTATDGSGNVSNFSQEICKDNCPYIHLPNVISPNGDGINDFFEAFPDSRFITSIDLEIANRWGRKIFSTEGLHVEDEYWNGTTNDGEVVSDGTYYFTLIAHYDSVNEGTSSKVYNGWIYVIR